MNSRFWRGSSVLQCRVCPHQRDPAATGGDKQKSRKTPKKRLAAWVAPLQSSSKLTTKPVEGEEILSPHPGTDELETLSEEREDIPKIIPQGVRKRILLQKKHYRRLRMMQSTGSNTRSSTAAAGGPPLATSMRRWGTSGHHANRPDTRTDGTADADAEPEAPVGAEGNADVAAGPPDSDTLPIGAAGAALLGEGTERPETETAQARQRPADSVADDTQEDEEARNSETHTVTDAMSTEPEDEELCPNGVPSSIRLAWRRRHKRARRCGLETTIWAAEMYWIQEEEKYYMGMPWGEEASEAAIRQRDDSDSDHARTDAESTDSEDWKMISNQRHTMRGVLDFLRMRKRWRIHQRQGYRALQRRPDPADQDPAAGPSAGASARGGPP